MDLHIGTSGYSYKEWKGRFYPEKLPAKDMLRFYSESFSALEINSTYYHMPTKRVLESWLRQVPERFVFALKAPRIITHVKRLRDVATETQFLFESLQTLGDRLGPVLFQFPESFRKNRPALEGFLDLIPRDKLCAFAFRSKSWVDAEITGLLHERGCSLCMEDKDEDPVDAIVNTASWGYLRLRRSDYADVDLSRWVGEVLSQGWDGAFVFFKHEDEARGPKLAMRFRELADAAAKDHAGH